MTSQSSSSYAPGMYQSPALQRVYWGKAAESIVKEVEKLGAQRVFLITSKTLQTTTSEIKSCEEALGEKHAGTWCGMRAHTPREDVLAGAAAAREAKCDLLVSIGGGSVTDGTKAINMCLTKSITELSDFDAYVGESFFGPDQWEHPGTMKQVAVPTTLSAGEFTHISGVTSLQLEHKQLYAHSKLQPVCVIFDPELSIYTPEWLWLSTGIRSVDHCTEAICSINGTHLSTAVASAALRLLAKALPRTKADPKDLDARLQCQIGCWQAVSTLMMGVHYGGSHAIGHVLGGTAEIPHGYTSCINLPYILEYNEPEIPEKCAVVADALGAEASGKLAAAQAMDQLIRSLGMPRTLSDVDFPMDKFQQVCENSMLDPWTACNPRKISSADDVKTILAMARDGVPNKAEMQKLRS